jgi:hypothetical protein
MNKMITVPEPNKLICEGLGCCNEASRKIRVKVGDNKCIILWTCGRCVDKFVKYGSENSGQTTSLEKMCTEEVYEENV